MVPALVLPEPLQTPGRSVHAQRPHQKAARCHVDPYQARCRRRYTSEMSFFCGYLRQFHSSTDCPRDISQSRAPRSVASRRQPLPTSHHRQARTSSQNVGGKSGAPLIGQCHYLPWTWVADALSMVMPKEHVTSSTSTFLAKFLTGFESACELCWNVWRKENWELGFWAWREVLPWQCGDRGLVLTSPFSTLQCETLFHGSGQGDPP